MMSEDSNPETNRRSMLNSVSDGHNVFDGDNDTSAERRPLLKGLATSFASILGLSSTASASSKGKGSEMRQKAERAIESYKEPASINKVVTKHGSELLTELTDNGFLTSANIADVRSAGVKIMTAPAENDPVEGTYVTASEQKGEFTAHISIVRKTPTRIVRINVQPQLGRSFATVKNRSGNLITVLDPAAEDDLSTQTVESSDDDVSIQKSCGTDGYTCPPSSCCYNCGAMQTKHERICCVYSDGSTSCYEEPMDKCCDPMFCC